MLALGCRSVKETAPRVTDPGPPSVETGSVSDVDSDTDVDSDSDSDSDTDTDIDTDTDADSDADADSDTDVDSDTDTDTDTGTKLVLPREPPYSALAARDGMTWAITEAGDAIAWGSYGSEMPGPFAQIAAGSFLGMCGVRPYGEAVCQGGLAPPPPGTYLKVAMSQFYFPSCGLLVDGSPVCWLPDGGGSGSSGPWEAPPGPFVDIAVTTVADCGLHIDGTPECWGNPHYIFHSGWLDLPLGPFVQISGNVSSVCGVRVDGAVQCWGENNNDEVDEAPPGTYNQVSGGDAGSFCAVATDGSVVCWGDCRWGECEPPKGTFVEVAVGWTHACALTVDGDAVCWGTDLGGETVPP
jgi:hypothetical protein